jgi:DNA processing protein
MLFIRGKTELNRMRAISIVGTRNPTDYGRTVTQELVQAIAAAWPDMLIVSGLAYGIDICAHRTSLRNNIDTVAVLGHGLSHLYPPAHRETSQQIIQKGALVSEFMHDEKPEAANFVRRNRIIAGMTDATIVVESGEQGGALITADIAASYNRDVLAYPGRTADRYSTGCNRLIKTNRAALMENLSDLEYLMGWQKQQKTDSGVQQLLFAELNDTESSLVSLLRSNGSMTIDQLALHANIPAGTASSMLLNLEFRGLVKCLPGKVFKIND